MQNLWNTEYHKFLQTYSDPASHNNRVIADGLVISLDSQKTHRNNHTFLLASCRDAQNWLYANILQANSSYLIPDYNGQVYESTHQYLRSQGYQVHVLNLPSPSAGIHYHPLVCLRPIDGTYQMSVENMIKAVLPRWNVKDPFWHEVQKEFLRTILYYIATLPPEQRTFDMLWQLFPDQNDSTPWNGGVMQHSDSPAVRSGLNALQKYPLRILTTALVDVRKTLASLQNLSCDTTPFNMEQLTNGRHAVYVVYNDCSNKNAITLFCTQVLDYLYAAAGAVQERKLMPSWLIYMNQWHPDLVFQLRLASKYNIGFALHCKNLKEWQQLHKYEFECVAGWCDTLMYAPSDECNEMEWMMNTIRYARVSKNDDTAQALRALRAVKPSQCVVCIRGERPFCCTKYQWTTHPNAKYILVPQNNEECPS